MGGVGKTTLAKACYQRVISTVEGIKYHFVGDINQRDAMETRMEEMITKLYSTLLSESNLTYDNLLFDERKRRLSHLRVFLVFDDVENLSQIERLLLGNHLSSTHLFAPGSRIILTTRNKMVVGNVGAKIYHVDCLSHIESLQLFQLHAFGESRPSDDLMGLSSRAVSYCQGCPLAIKVVGGALIGKSRDYWVSFLSDMRQIPTPEIRHVLMRSYNALGGKEIQSLFLDIACFFYGTNKSLVTKYSPAYHLLEVLIDKSLCTCVVERTRERIQVHALLRELAWSIVNDESIKLENPTRLNNLGDIQKLLTKKSLPSLQSQCPKVTRCPEIDSRELMILDLEQTPVRALPLAIYNIKEGGCLSLSGRHITCFPAISTSLDLLGLTFTLITEMNCYDDHQLGSLPRFSALELVANLQLKSLPKHLWSMVSRSLLIHYCPSIETLPEIFHPVTAIVELDQLTDLELPNNKRLKFLPCDIHKLAKLSYLNLSSCTKIKFLPELPPSLLTLCVSGCTLLQALPSNADKLRFKDLYFEDCPQLDPDLPQQVMLNFYDLAASDLHPKVFKHCNTIIIILSFKISIGGKLILKTLFMKTSLYYWF
ncbi:unnamed protein product [Linum tenue]|uniref:NB-ARC domain-containing protein n=1 Tax=Linum tenue TaxID=586396 RepID=A0AAV0GRI2_9ROSI|nr:unnamed protein product [Linum tenue]